MPQLLPSSPDTSRRMAKVRQKGTDAEVALRREMYRIGLRYRIDYEVLRRPRRVADIAFPGRKIAIFVDGCFWHGLLCAMLEANVMVLRPPASFRSGTGFPRTSSSRATSRKLRPAP